MTLRADLQRGFAVIAALFLVVVLAAFGAFMLTFSNTQQITAAQDLQGSRAYWAATAGLEWGLSYVITKNSCPNPSPTSPSGLSLDGGFSISVTCIQEKFSEAGVDKLIFNLTSVAKNSANIGSLGYVERSLSAKIEQ